MNKKLIYRCMIYLCGLLILSMGLVLNTKAGLGVSPIISVAYCISEITGKNFGDMTLLWYTVLVIVEMIIHVRIVKRDRLRRVLLTDVLQIALSLVFTRFVNLFSALFPSAQELAPDNLIVKLLVLAAALILTGCGAAMSLDVRIIPNPGDGIVQAFGDAFHKNVGFMKNCVDISCAVITTVISLTIAGRIIGIGIGTVIAMIAVGRVVALFNYFFLDQIEALR